tara:strand:+ start:332 stop:679 length:348 start_codon:yes stop_codon:yes gene_type:complete
MNKDTINLLDQATIILLNNGLYAKLDQLRKQSADINSETGLLKNDWDRTEQYLALAKLNVHFEQAALKSYQHTALETKLSKLQIAAAKVQVEVARENRDDAYLTYTESRDSIGNL